MTDIYDQYFKEDIIEKAPSQNTGNDFAPNNRQPTFNVYDDFFKQQETSINNQVKRSLQLVMEKDPDKTGEALRLQEELGLHKSLALDSDEAIKLMRARNERKRLDSLELAKFSPILHRQLTDPKFAALAYDNLEDLQGLEKLFDDFTSIPENIGQGWAKGRLQMRRGHIGVERWLGKTDEKTDFELAEIDARLKEMEADGTGPFEEAFAVFGQYSKSLPKAVAAGTAGAGVGAAAGSWTGPGSAFTAKAGFVWGFMGSLAYDSLAIEGGNTYLALTEEDFNPTHSRWIALGTGLTSAALELWGLGIVTAPIRKLLVKQTTKQVAKQLAKPSGRLALGNFITNYAKIGTLESLTEVGQELTQILGRELAVLLDDREDIKSQLTSWEGVGEVAHQLSTVFLRSLQAMSIVGLVGSGPTFISDIQKARNTKKNEVFFEELTKQSSTSKLKERSVTDFENLTQQIGDKKNVSHIYVDANVFNNAMRQEGLSIEDVEKVSPTIANQLKELEKSGTISGGDIVIPIGEYSSKLIGTDFDNKILKQHRRLDKEDSFSTAENTFFEANREKLEKEANEIRNRDENRNKEFRASAVKVKRDFVNMLRATGMGKATSKFRPKDVQYAATFYRDYAITQANKLKILPHEFAERFPFKIVGPDQVQIFQNQQLLDDTDNELRQLEKQLNELKSDDIASKDAITDKIDALRDARETYLQRTKPQEQGKPVPDSVSQVNKLENSFDFAKSKPFPTNRQFKIELQERVKQAAKEAGIDVNDGSIETEKYLVQSVIDDANFALIENSNAVGWYNEKVTKAKRILSLIHPELDTDPVANFAFTWALANTSNMIKVDKNFELAEKAYRHYKKTGKFPTNIGIGKASDSINNNFKLFNRLIREKEFTNLEEFMKTQHTVKEVKAYTNSGVSGENLSEIVYGAAVMGPKIGNGFFANLYGFFEQLTMDRWLIRSWGRLTGTLVLDQRKQANMKRDQLKPLLKALSPKQRKKLQDLIGVKIRMTNLDEVAVAIDNASTDKPNRKIMNEIATIKDQPEVEQVIFDILGKPKKGSDRIGIGHEIRKNGVSYTKFLDGQKEAPSGAPERRFIRKVFNQALDVLQQDNPDLTMADLQALLWYPEKRLYDSAKLVEAEDTKGYVDDEAPDYANAAVGLAKTFGISDVDIQSTLQEVDLEIQNQSIDRARVAESGERRPDGIQQDNETFRQGRRNFDTPTDEGTGLPLNGDGTVTIYHHTDKQSADAIRESNRLEYTTRSDPFFTTRDTADLGYGDTSIAIRLDPARLSVDDEFPDGRRDFRLNNRKARESISVEIDENPNVPDFAPTSDQLIGDAIRRVVELGEPYMGEYGDKSPNVVDKELRDKASALFGAQAATPEEAAAARARIIEKTKLRRTRRNLEKQSKLFSEQQVPKELRGQFELLDQILDNIRKGNINKESINSPDTISITDLKRINALTDLTRFPPGKETENATKRKRQWREKTANMSEAEADAFFALSEKEKTKLKETYFALKDLEEGGGFKQQASKGSRGQFDPKNLTTILTKEADLSTFLHETAHYMLTVMEELVASGKATQRMIDDFDKLLDFFDVADFDTWNKLSLNEKRKYHESFAYNFEIYMAEEKAAPNVKLQEIFVKFRNFLTRIYQSIRGELNDLYKAENGVDLPILTDEIRGVMDRMLASEQEIIQSQKIYNMKPMFETQESSGMNDAEWAEYTKNIQEAQDEAINELSKKSVAQMKWLENAKSKEIKKLQKKERETRNKVKNEEMEKAKKEKAYRLQAFLKTGKTVNQEGEPIVVDKAPKIRKADVKNYIPFYDATDELKRLRGMVADDGVPASLLAELFEYESSAAMINALVDLQDIKDLVKERTDRIMLENYSELSDPKQQLLAALEAIHNQARAKFIATELRFLSKAMQPVRYQVAAARQVAKDILAKTPLKEIRPSQFARAQARAVKLTEKAMMEGNTKEAIAKKRAQLVQHELAREAIRIHNVYKKAEKDFDKFFKKSDKDLKNTRNIDLINAARSILAAYGVGPAVDNPTIYLDKLAAYNQDVYLRLQPIIEDATSFGAKELTDLTAQQFETLYEQIQSLDYQSRMDKVIEKDGKKVSLEREVATLSYELDRIAFIKNNEAIGQKGTLTRMEEVRYMFQGLESTTARVEHMMDNFDGAVRAGAGATLDRATAEAGPFTKLIWRPVKNALDAYRPERNKFTKKYAAMLQMLADAGRLGKEKIVSHEIDFTFGNGGTVPGKVELLGAMLHIGNSSNKRKLLLGRGWAEKLSDGSIDTSKWDAFMARMENEGYINKDDWDFLQEAWDLNEEMKPIAQKAHREVYGYYFKEIEATPIVNKFGTYRGGYVPAALDPKMDRQRKALKELEELDTEYRQTLPSTGDGFTKSRNERFAGPLSLDLRIMTKHIDDALRFAYVQPAIKNVHKILKHKDFAQKLAVINPTYMDNMLIPWLNNAARQKTFVPGAHPESIDVFWQTVRKRTGVGIMFANISNAMQQLTGYFPAMLKVEPRYLKGALGQYLQAPNKFANEIAELSPFMAERQNTQIFDIQDNLNELLINPNEFEKVQKWATHHGYFLQQAFQNQVDSVVWAASYEKTMAELPKTFTFEQARAEAIQQADANVRLTQDSLSAEDLPAFMVTTPFIKTFLQFGNYFNMIANLNGTAYKKIMRDLGWRGNKGKLFMTYLLGFAMPAFVADMIVRALGEGFIDDEEDGIADDFMGWYFGSQIRSAAALVPFGTAALVGINMLDNKPYNDRITVSPSVSILEASLRAPITTILALTSEDKDLSGRNVKDLLTFLSLVTGVPLTILGKPIGYQVDVNQGKIDPTGLPDYVRGLITGKASGKSRN